MGTNNNNPPPEQAVTATKMALISSSACCQVNTMIDVERLVVVRYYLDRPGYNLDNASARFWKNPPKVCHANDIKEFLTSQGIIDDKSTKNTLGMIDDDDEDDGKIVCSPQKQQQKDSNNNAADILVEVYMPSFGAFIVLDVAEESGICYDFSNATKMEPTRIDIRLTDLNEIMTGSNKQNGGGGNYDCSSSSSPPQCSMSIAGLFGFVMINGLEGTYMLMKLTSEYGFVAESYMLIYGPYAFFVGGLLQLLAGMWEVKRNNIYGATAFSCFGSFWMAKGTIYTLKTYFPSQLSDEILDSGADEWGHFIVELYVLLLVLALLKVTFTMNKTTTALICTLIIKLVFAAIEEFHEVLLWIHCVLTFLLSFFAGYVFYAEFVNEVYQPAPFDLIAWNPSSSSEEAFGARGRLNGLQPRALQLRLARGGERGGGGSDVSPNNMNMTVRSCRAANTTKNKLLEQIHVKEA